MVKLLKLGKPKRKKRYFQTQCPFCNSVLAFEQEDIWFDDPKSSVARLRCPICRTHFNFFMINFDNGNERYDNFINFGSPAEEIVEEVYLTAQMDTSKSGLEMLMADKAREKAEE